MTIEIELRGGTRHGERMTLPEFTDRVHLTFPRPAPRTIAQPTTNPALDAPYVETYVWDGIKLDPLHYVLDSIPLPR